MITQLNYLFRVYNTLVYTVLYLIIILLESSALSTNIQANSFQENPVSVIETLHTTLIDTMKNARNLGWKGRYDKLFPVLVNTYDFSDMARIVVGSYWKTLSEIQKKRIITEFSRFSVATYARRFNDYNQERFETTAVEEVHPPSLGVIVRTRLIQLNGSSIQFSYRLENKEGKWKVMDIFYRGMFSELANQRAQYLAVLNSLGYDELIKKLETKVQELAKD